MHRRAFVRLLAATPLAVPFQIRSGLPALRVVSSYLPAATPGILRLKFDRDSLPRTPVRSRREWLDLPDFVEGPRASSALRVRGHVCLCLFSARHAPQHVPLTFDF